MPDHFEAKIILKSSPEMIVPNQISPGEPIISGNSVLFIGSINNAPEIVACRAGIIRKCSEPIPAYRLVSIVVEAGQSRVRLASQTQGLRCHGISISNAAANDYVHIITGRGTILEAGVPEGSLYLNDNGLMGSTGEDYVGSGIGGGLLLFDPI